MPETFTFAVTALVVAVAHHTPTAVGSDVGVTVHTGAEVNAVANVCEPLVEDEIEIVPSRSLFAAEVFRCAPCCPSATPDVEIVARMFGLYEFPAVSPVSAKKSICPAEFPKRIPAALVFEASSPKNEHVP